MTLAGIEAIIANIPREDREAALIALRRDDETNDALAWRLCAIVERFRNVCPNEGMVAMVTYTILGALQGRRGEDLHNFAGEQSVKKIGDELRDGAFQQHER